MNSGSEEKEALINKIINKLSMKENFKNYFIMKYSEGSFIEFQNSLFNSEAFLFEVGKELFEIEGQISVFPEESKFSPVNSDKHSNTLRNNHKMNNFSKKEEFSKTQTSNYSSRQTKKRTISEKKPSQYFTE